MKKIISLIICVAMLFSLTGVISFAANGETNFAATADATTVKIGDTVTVSLSMINEEVNIDTVGVSIVFDPAVFECTAMIPDEDSDNRLAGYLVDDEADISTLAEANTSGAFGIGKSSSKERSYEAGGVCTFTFKAIAASEGSVLKFTENTGGTDGYVNMDGIAFATVVVKGDDPAPSNPEVTPDNGTEDADDAKIWAVAVDGGYVANGDVLVATLTNNGDTQVVNLTVDGVDGGADWAFNLKVRFKDVANRATTTLAIAKAN